MNQRRVVRASDIMKKHFIELDGLMTVKDAVNAMIAEDAQVLIVKKRHEDDEYGIVLLSDIAKKVLAQDRSPERVNVYEVMTKPVIAVSPTMDVRYCSRLFERFGLANVPVIDNGKVLGIVGYAELVLQGMAEE